MAREVDAANLMPISKERSPHSHVEQADLRHLIQRALAELAPALREAVVKRDLQEFSYQEIASQLDLPEGTVKSRINRGRLELARQIRRLQAEGPNPDVPSSGGTT